MQLSGLGHVLREGCVGLRLNIGSMELRRLDQVQAHQLLERRAPLVHWYGRKLMLNDGLLFQVALCGGNKDAQFRRDVTSLGIVALLHVLQMFTPLTMAEFEGQSAQINLVTPPSYLLQKLGVVGQTNAQQAMLLSPPTFSIAVCVAQADGAVCSHLKASYV